MECKMLQGRNEGLRGRKGGRGGHRRLNWAASPGGIFKIMPHQVAHPCFHENRNCSDFQTNNTCCQVEKGTDGSFVFSGKWKWLWCFNQKIPKIYIYCLHLKWRNRNIHEHQILRHFAILTHWFICWRQRSPRAGGGSHLEWKYLSRILSFLLPLRGKYQNLIITIYSNP